MNGALLIDKPEGWTSHDVVARVRRLTGERRVGHTGTLDPFATGLLVILVGRATRLAQFLSSAEKEYEAVIRLGYATETGDRTGARLEPASHAKTPSPQSLSKEEIEAAMASLRGEIEQTPPMYSAKKVGGRKLYELAREGTEVERKPLLVSINEFELRPRDGALLTENDDGTCDLAVRVACSAGTYVRTLAEDFGKRLDIGAHLAELRRTRAGRFTIDEAATLDRLEETTQRTSITERLIAPDAALSHLPLVELNSAEAAQTLHGIGLKVDELQAERWPNDQPVRMRSEHGELIAVGMYDQAENVVHPRVVISNA
ncbi:MAG: tRNA pseudouridine(55) synthase TruB [Pyrinomonadaceae bacterium]